MTTPFDFTNAYGGEVAQEEAARQFSNIEKTHWFPQLKDQEVCFMRMLTDEPEWITVRQHNMVPTKPKPQNWQGKNWPASMSATCRRDKIFGGHYPDCYIEDNLTKEDGKKRNAVARTWAKAVMREEVRGTQEMVDAGQIKPEDKGKRLGFRDKEREVDEVDKEGKPTGKKIREKDVVILNMAWDNFFSKIQGVYGAREMATGTATVLDVDLYVKRIGTGLNTDYQIANLDATEGFNLNNNPELLSRYGEVVKSPRPGRENVSVISMADIQKIIVDRSTDEFFATFFDPTKEPPARQGNSNGSGPAQAPKQSNDVEDNPEAMQALQDRIKGFNAPQTQTEPTAPAAGGGMINFN